MNLTFMEKTSLMVHLAMAKAHYEQCGNDPYCRDRRYWYTKADDAQKWYDKVSKGFDTNGE